MIQVAFYGTIRKDLSSFMFYGDCNSFVLLNTLYVAALKLVLFEFHSRAGEEQLVEWDCSRGLFFSCSRIPFRFSEGSNTDSLIWWFGHREKAYAWDFYFLRPRQRKGIGPVRSVPVLPVRADLFPYAGAKEQASEQVSKPASISGLTAFAERMPVLSVSCSGTLFLNAAALDPTSLLKMWNRLIDALEKVTTIPPNPKIRPDEDVSEHALRRKDPLTWVLRLGRDRGNSLWLNHPNLMLPLRQLNLYHSLILECRVNLNRRLELHLPFPFVNDILSEVNPSDLNKDREMSQYGKSLYLVGR
ncbi:hypothetical protein E1A91_A13G102300v1 [Gossypium mustelinum]|uniref:Uncharacterized protein n=1 Tax=Gossypium mustelinum TaxID=34275 RepID=A0A5D2WGX9_GOSMU|nr:hypothetical protein E1A91_A13G102300v1 [Gossypium mustelinum]